MGKTAHRLLLGQAGLSVLGTACDAASWRAVESMGAKPAVWQVLERATWHALSSLMLLLCWLRMCCSLLCRYGGLACRDLMAMARGLLEVTDEAYQVYRHG
jgi:hypothetical protein